MIPYIDIHSHLGGAIEEQLIRIHSFKLSNELPLPCHPFSAGIHPWDTSLEWNYEVLLTKLNTIPAIAIGEIGLDFNLAKSTHKQQQFIFERQLAIASLRNLPVIIHCVKAFEPTMELLKHYTLPAVIFHGYIGSFEQTQRIDTAGYYISLGSTSFLSTKTITGVATFPLKRLFLETDDTNKKIADIYATASELLSIPQAELLKIIYETFKIIFPNL